MTNAQRDAILRAYYSERNSYETFAEEFRRLLNPLIDPSVPADAIYTITHRLKDEARLIEKLKNEEGQHEVTVDNYASFVKDLLGLRIVCLRLSDVERVKTFLASLKDEGRIKLLEGPEEKKTFVLQVDPRDEPPSDIDLQYSGYSSLHYVIGFGEAQRPTPALEELRAELQVRTLLEEAWGEIDHKYRYELARTGVDLPDFLNRGFYSFAAYLQAATLQAEFLCLETEKLRGSDEAGQGLGVTAEVSPQPPMPPIAALVQSTVGFVPSQRTLNYVAKRLRESGLSEDQLGLVAEEVLSAEVLEHFRSIYQDVVKGEPFQDEEERDIDLINLLNFGLFMRSQSETVASAGARDVLSRRFRER